jgi:hypothetical protein
MSNLAGEEWAGRLDGVLTGLVREWNDGKAKGKEMLEIKRSHYELHREALYVAARLLRDHAGGEGDEGGKILPRTAGVAKGEAAHVHGDRSVHLYLHPADARLVIERGWGERHRLSRTWPWYLGGGESRLGLGNTWIMLYGPRDEGEFEVVKRLIGEGVRWMLGERKG